MTTKELNDIMKTKEILEQLDTTTLDLLVWSVNNEPEVHGKFSEAIVKYLTIGLKKAQEDSFKEYSTERDD